MSGTRIRVLIVDDSVVIRRLISDVLAGDPEIDVVGTAVNGKNALDKLGALKPDVITLDIEMPVMDGLQTLVELRKRDKKTPVIMFSTLTERGAGATLDALERGASDYVTKPANVGSVSESMEAVRVQLIPKIKSLTGHAPPVARPAFITGPRPGAPAARQGDAPLAHASPTGRTDIVAIGVSTGGPDALTHVISHLPASIPVPIVVTQHMPPVFTKLFAERLDGKSPLKVAEAVHGQVVVAGHVYIAPGDYHMRLHRQGNQVVVGLDQGPQENYCRPAVDPMFRSVHEVYGGHVLTVVMTGMGRDGAAGAEPLIRSGAKLIVQDEATSVVWGMPGACVQAGLPCDVLPLDQIATAITAATRGVRAEPPTPKPGPAKPGPTRAGSSGSTGAVGARPGASGSPSTRSTAARR